MRIVPYRLTATIPAAASGTTATLSGRSWPRGKILAVQIDYPTNTVAVALASTGELVSQTILSLGAANTDATVYPRIPMQTNAGANITYDGTKVVYTEFVVYGNLTLTLSSGTAGESVSITVYVEEQ